METESARSSPKDRRESKTTNSSCAPSAQCREDEQGVTAENCYGAWHGRTITDVPTGDSNTDSIPCVCYKI